MDSKLAVVRALTDDHVLRALMRHRRLTRAELATEVGISKPTAGESVRRLAERGLVADTGERTPGGRGRGRVGSYYSLAPSVGSALAVTIAAEGVVVERMNIYGDAAARAERPVEPAPVSAALAAAAEEACASQEQPVRLAVVGAADPVDRQSGRLVHLPDSPFLVGDLDPVSVLAPFVAGPVVVDNDVNWAAQAERDHRGDGLRDFAYLYLGAGLGCAVVNDGEIRRGRTGLVGEVAHLLTAGPDGRAVRFIDVFGHLGLCRPRSTAIDAERLRAADASTLAAVGTAVAGVVDAIVALADPECVVVGGTWGPTVLGVIQDAIARSPRPVACESATVTTAPVLDGVRAAALNRLRGLVAAPE